MKRDRMEEVLASLTPEQGAAVLALMAEEYHAVFSAVHGAVASVCTIEVHKLIYDAIRERLKPVRTYD